MYSFIHQHLWTQDLGRDPSAMSSRPQSTVQAIRWRCLAYPRGSEDSKASLPTSPDGLNRNALGDNLGLTSPIIWKQKELQVQWITTDWHMSLRLHPPKWAGPLQSEECDEVLRPQKDAFNRCCALACLFLSYVSIPFIFGFRNCWRTFCAPFGSYIVLFINIPRYPKGSPVQWTVYLPYTACGLPDTAWMVYRCVSSILPAGHSSPSYSTTVRRV